MRRISQRFVCLGLGAALLFAAAGTVMAAEDQPEPAPLHLACIGDSLTSGFQLTAPEKDSYPAQLAVLLGKAWEVKSYAVPGRTALRKAERPLWKEAVFAEAQAANPDVIVLCLGTNDSWPSLWRSLGGEFKEDLQAMVELFLALPSKPTVWLCLPPPLFVDGIEEQKRIMSTEINPAIQAVAAATGCKLIDWYSPLAGQKSLFQNDGVHPAPEGAALMARLVAAQISGTPSLKQKPDKE